jgi:xyloglucan-specific exo-beta-1,4-glucanase
VTRHLLVSACVTAVLGCGTSSGGGSSAGGRAGSAGAPSIGTGGSLGGGGSPAGQGGSGPPTGTGGGAPTGPYAWKNVAIGGGGFVSGIVFSAAQNGLAYARTDVGGLYRWNAATETWTPLTDMFSMAQGNYLGGESIAPDPTDPNVVYAAAGMYESSGNGVILRSTNQGASWTVNTIGVTMGGNENGRGMGERLAVDPNNNTILLFGSRPSGLYKSSDSGAHWAKVTSFPTTGDVDIANSYGGTTNFGLPVVLFDKTGGSAAGSTSIYVAAAAHAAGSNLYHSTDGGTSWTEVSGGPTGLMVHHGAVASDGTVWLAYSSDYGPYNVGGGTLTGQIWKLSSAGAWTNVTPPSANWSAMAGGLSIDAQNANHVIVSTLDWYGPDRLLATTDGGTSWIVVGQPPAYGKPGSTYDAQGANFWFVDDATQIGQGATNWVEAVALDPFDPNHAMYGTGAGIWNSTDIGSATGANGQGATWTFNDQGLEETVPIFLGPSVKGAFLGAIGDLGGMRNTNLDAYSATGEYSNPIDNNTSGLDLAESNPNFVVRVGSNTMPTSNVAYSMDNGLTWNPVTSVPSDYNGPSNMGSVAVAADGSRFLVAPTSGHGNPAFTTNNGATWTTCAGLTSGALLAADRVTAMTFYATVGGTLYVSTNGGATFAAANTFTGSGAPRTVFGQAGEVWVAAKGGALYRFTNAGATKTTIATVSAAWGVGFGMAAAGQTHPATFIIGTVGGQYGFFRSDDGVGTAWTRINDDQHQFGWLQNDYIAGDETTFGRVYLTTGGRGYVYGDPNP